MSVQFWIGTTLCKRDGEARDTHGYSLAEFADAFLKYSLYDVTSTIIFITFNFFKTCFSWKTGILWNYGCQQVQSAQPMERTPENWNSMSSGSVLADHSFPILELKFLIKKQIWLGLPLLMLRTCSEKNCIPRAITIRILFIGQLQFPLGEYTGITEHDHHSSEHCYRTQLCYRTACFWTAHRITTKI